MPLALATRGWIVCNRIAIIWSSGSNNREQPAKDSPRACEKSPQGNDLKGGAPAKISSDIRQESCHCMLLEPTRLDAGRPLRCLVCSLACLVGRAASHRFIKLQELFPQAWPSNQPCRELSTPPLPHWAPTFCHPCMFVSTASVVVAVKLRRGAP